MPLPKCRWLVFKTRKGELPEEKTPFCGDNLLLPRFGETMREIPLSQGKIAFVDDEDYEYLSQFRWYANNIQGLTYARRTVRRAPFMHHMILSTIPKGKVTDHIDGNGLNNQRSNLRIVTMRENTQNLHIKKSSKYPGVTWHKATQKWMAQAYLNGKHAYLGVYATEEEAYQVYQNGCEKHA